MIVKVGVIGIGTVSQLMHLPILSGLHEQYQITAVSDISPTQIAFIAKKYNATHRGRYRVLRCTFSR